MKLSIPNGNLRYLKKNVGIFQLHHRLRHWRSHLGDSHSVGRSAGAEWWWVVRRRGEEGRMMMNRRETERRGMNINIINWSKIKNKNSSLNYLCLIWNKNIFLKREKSKGKKGRGRRKTIRGVRKNEFSDYTEKTAPFFNKITTFYLISFFYHF